MPHENSLAHLTVVVTGANGALGRAVVNLALARGAQVVGVDMAFADTPCASGERRLSVDLCDPAATQLQLGNVGDFDVLCNLAGGFAMGETAFDAGENCDPRATATWRGADRQCRRAVGARRASTNERLLRGQKHRHAPHRKSLA